jgi:hypothetical protein
MLDIMYILDYIKSIQDQEVILVKNIIKLLLKQGQVTLIELRAKTNYSIGSREISWSLKRLRAIGLLTYENRVWYFNNSLIVMIGYQTFQKTMLALTS